MDQRQKCIRDGLIVPARDNVPMPACAGVLSLDHAGGERSADHEGAFWVYVNETNEWEMPAMTQDADWFAFFEFMYGPQDACEDAI